MCNVHSICVCKKVSVDTAVVSCNAPDQHTVGQSWRQA